MRRIITLVLLIVFTMAISVTASAAVLAANKTQILFDGQKIPGLIGLAYKVYKDRQDVRGIPMRDRVGAVYGRLHVKGKILVHSNSELLDWHMDNNTSFQIILAVMQDSYPEGLSVKTFTFDGCHIDDREFQLDGGFAIYSLTCEGVRGVFPTEFGMLTPGHLNAWELDENGESFNTLIMVTEEEESEVTEIKLNEWTLEEAVDYQITSHIYASGD